MIELGHFSKQLNRLGVRWPNITNSELVPRYYNHVKDLPEDAVKQIVNNLLDSSSAMPLPKDFLQAASEWRKAFFMKNGYYYGTEKGSELVVVPDCKYCEDGGIREVIPHGSEVMAYLMRCDCSWGDRHEAIMPQWDKGLSQGFKTRPPALENFKPDDPTKATFSNILEKWKSWKTTLIKNQNYWRALGYGKKENI